MANPRNLAKIAPIVSATSGKLILSDTATLNGGTANSLVYLNANKEATTVSTLSFNGTNLGVGTSSPGSTLDVKGTLRLSGALSGYVGLTVASNAGAVTYTLPASDGLNGNVLSTNGTGSLSWIPMTGGGGANTAGSGSSTSRTTLVATEGQTSFSVNYVVGQIDIFLNGVKLAIGTEVTANTGTTAVLAKGAKAGDIFDATVYSTQWNTSVTNLYYDGGNIGIGTSIPNYSSFGGTNKVLSIKGSSTYGAVELVSDETPADGNFLGQFVFANSGSGVTSKDSALIAAKQSGTSATAPGGSLHFYTRTNAGSLSERVIINSSGNLLVGATSSNNNSFVVQGTHTGGRSIAAIRTNSSGNNAPIILGFYDSLDSRQGYIGVNSNSSFVLVSQGNLPMNFSTNEVERMSIDTSGNIGIGTTSPETTLHLVTTPGTYNATVTQSANVGGGIIVRANNSGSSSRVGLFLQGSDRIGAAIASAREDSGTTWRTYLAFYTNNLTGNGIVTSLQEKLRITSDGNVGIGTNSDSPNAKLHVYGASSTGYTTYFRTTGSPYTDIGGYADTSIGNGRWVWEAGTVPGSGTAQFYTHFRTRTAVGTSQHNVIVDGNLGIGTSSPAQKLDVYGNGMKVNNASYVGYLGADSVFGSSGVASSFTVRSDNALTFSTGGPYTRATLDSSGNLGLGVVPSVWDTVSVLQIKNAAFGGFGQFAYMNANAFYQSGNWKYIATDFASRYEQSSGSHRWHTAPSGTAGNAISFTQAMTLDASGRWVVGSSSPSTLRATIEDNGNQLRIRNTTTRYRSDYAVVADGSAEINVFDDSGGVYMPLRFAANTVAFFTGSGSVTERARITSGGDLLVGTTSSGNLNGRVAVAGTSGNASIGTLSGSGTGALDTGISINQNNGGACIVLIASRNVGAGTQTDAAVYIVRFYYDGNNAPTTVYVGGSLDFVTFGTSGSNTLTLTNSAGGNAQYSWFGNK